MIKKILLIATILFINIAHAERLSAYDDVSQAIIEGKGIRAVFDASLCKGASLNQSAPIGSVTPKDVAVIPGKYITFANLHFTRHHPGNQGKAVYESVKFVLKPSQQFTMEAVVLDPVTFEEQGQRYTIECELNKGVSVFSTH